MQASSRYRFLFGSLLLVLAVGCRTAKRAQWLAPEIAQSRATCCTLDSTLAKAEMAHAHAVALEKQGNAACVDFYYQSARLSWCEIQRQIGERCGTYRRAADVYRSSLAQLVSAGQRFGRFDPRRGLDVRTESGAITVPTSYYGFLWQPDDFNCLIPVGQYSTKDLNHRYACCGQGISTVALRCRKPNEPFHRDQQVFAATVVLRPIDGDVSSPAEAMVLELYDPLRVSSIDVTGHSVELQRDLTAPFAYRLSNADREYLKAFLQPGSNAENAGLFMIEPYQPGKIPVVFVHGLLSDPMTWVNIANELRSHPDVLGRYQIWGYEYATGEEFLKSAAVLRRQLQGIQWHLDPAGNDRALSQMVLVGHSMGGLITKLQITSSGNKLWNSVSCCPLESITTSPETRILLAEAFYFEPLPTVSRVVFVGTPHRGSSWARRSVGQLGSKLVEEPSSLRDRHQQLIRDNPGVFSREFTRRIPTSIDLLKPNSPLLRAIDELPMSDRVRFHTLFGNGFWMFAAGDSDKVVPVSSARKTGAVSEKSLPTKHTKLNQDPDGIDELLSILRTHLIESQTDVLTFDAKSPWVHPMGK